MKKILGYIPGQSSILFVPKFILFENGLFDKNGKPADGNTIQTSPININENEWIGLDGAGKIETFKLSEENDWKSRVAQKALEQMPNPQSDPESALKFIRSLAEFMGIEYSQLFEKLKNFNQH